MLRKKASLKKQIYKVCILDSWWVWGFALLCYFLYNGGIKKKQETYATLQARMMELQAQKLAMLEIQENLLLEINSESDPAWVELTLMRRLGMVPEGQKKVYFKNNE